MKNKFKILSVAVICLFTVQAFAQFSRNDAISLVQNTILAGDMGKVDVYASTGLISGNVHRVDNETVEVPYSGSWVFFVDDKPWAGWFHDCRYIFVNGQNGEYSIVNSTIYPKNQAIGYELINEATGNGQADLGVATGTQVDGLPPNDHYFAVIICVEDYQENWNDLSLVYNTLIDIYGYKNGNIFVHYGEDGTSGTTYGGDLDNDDLNDLDYSAFSTDIHATFNELAGITSLNNDIPVLDVDDQLAIFVVDAPTLDVLPGTTLWGFWDDNGGGPYIDLEDPLEVAQIVDQINCAQMIMTFSFNFAGGVIDEFEDLSGQANCSARYIHACNFYEEKHSEQYITGGTYGEYFYYWAAAARGVYPDLYPWEPGIDAGSFDFTSITGLENHPGDYDPDENGDGYVQMEEAFNYANAMDTWSNDGYYYNPYVPGEVEVPLDDNGLPFIDDVMTLAGYAGLIETTDIYGGNFVIGGNLSFGPVTLPYKFELDDNTGLYMVNPQASITILENSKVDLGSDMIIAGNSITNKFTVQGRLTTSGTGIEFKGIDGGQWKGLVYDDATEWNFNTFYLSSFTDCLISGNTKSLTLNTIEFINSGIYLAVSKITVSNSVFTNSYADLTHNFSGYEYLHFFRNKFWGEGIIKPAVKLNSFPNFHLFDTYINDHSGGINIYNSGTGTADHLIKVCYIHLCSGAGIKIYHSTADLQNNKSKDNDYGVMVYNNSNVGVFGNEFAWYTGETQLFKDNDSYEFYCSRSSFPHTFRWNAIIDEDNTEPMVYVSGYEYPLDVRNNAWGNNFDPQEDLFPWVAYIYEPVWTLTYDSSEENLAESLYFSSTAAEADSNYAMAQIGYKQVISSYPDSKYAEASMKKLCTVESYVNKDYSGLKSYLSSEPNIVNDPDLVELSEFLINFCDIKLENWPTAIAWFENVIQNPESMEDSIFAIIDLGYTYFLMEQSGYKNAYIGTMTEHIPVSQVKFEEKRDYLLSLIPGDQISEILKENIGALKNGELLQNVPNPFNGSTQIWYKLENESTVQLYVYNYTGQLIKSINVGPKTKGNHFVEFDAGGLKNGIYFYSISINGQISDSKKMTIVK